MASEITTPLCTPCYGRLAVLQSRSQACGKKDQRQDDDLPIHVCHPNRSNQRKGSAESSFKLTETGTRLGWAHILLNLHPDGPHAARLQAFRWILGFEIFFVGFGNFARLPLQSYTDGLASFGTTSCINGLFR